MALSTCCENYSHKAQMIALTTREPWVVQRPTLQPQKCLLCASVAPQAPCQVTQAYLRLTHLWVNQARKRPGTKQRSPLLSEDFSNHLLAFQPQGWLHRCTSCEVTQGPTLNALLSPYSNSSFLNKRPRNFILHWTLPMTQQPLPLPKHL